jgi:hypothetical protein
VEPDQDEVAAAWTEDARDEGVTAMARLMQSRATASVGKELGEVGEASGGDSGARHASEQEEAGDARGQAMKLSIMVESTLGRIEQRRWWFSRACRT